MTDLVTTWDAEVTQRMPAILTHWDARVGTSTKSTSWDTVLRERGTASMSWDSLVRYQRLTSWDAFLTEETGTFRGIGEHADRDLVEGIQPGDSFVVTDTEHAPQKSVWDGGKWLEGDAVFSREAKQRRPAIFPTYVEGWYVEAGDPEYPLQYTDGAIRRFSVDALGTVESVGMLTQTMTADGVLLTEAAVPVASAVVQNASGAGIDTASASATWPAATTLGNCLIAYYGGWGATTSTNFTAPAGWTKIDSTIINGVGAWAVYVRYNSAVQSGAVNFSDTATPASNQVRHLFIAELSGIDVAPFDVSDRSTLYPPQTGFENTLYPYEAWVGFVTEIGNASLQGSPSNGYTEVDTEISLTSGGADRNMASAFLFRTADAKGQAGSSYGTQSPLPVGSEGMMVALRRKLTLPSTPPADHGRIYVADRAGITNPYFLDDTGDTYDMRQVQPITVFTADEIVHSGTTAVTPIQSFVLPDELPNGMSWRWTMAGLRSNIATSGQFNWGIDFGTPPSSWSSADPWHVVGSQANAGTDEPWWWDMMLTISNEVIGVRLRVASHLRVLGTGLTDVAHVVFPGLAVDPGQTVRAIVRTATSNAGNIITLQHGQLHRLAYSS